MNNLNRKILFRPSETSALLSKKKCHTYKYTIENVATRYTSPDGNNSDNSARKS